jgi:AraC-like DNA-binding protein
MLEGSASSYHGNLMVVHQALLGYGLDADSIVAEAGINKQLYEDSAHRVPADLMDHLFRLCYERTGDASFGLECIEYLSPANYHALGVGLLYSSTLRDFCQRFERFFSLITTLDTLRFSDEKSLNCLRLRPISDLSSDIHRFDSDSFNALVLKFVRMIYKPDYTPKKICLTWAPPKDYQQKYLDYFGCEVEFSAPVTEFHFDPADMDEPLSASNVELARQNDTVVVEFLGRMDKIDLPSRVYAKLIELLPAGHCNREMVASALHMSTSSFHEKLKKAGTNYQDLLDQTRQQLAKSYMAREDLSISEIAYLLGFSDSSNFSRSFKRWLGQSPREYRQQITSMPI